MTDLEAACAERGLEKESAWHEKSCLKSALRGRRGQRVERRNKYAWKRSDGAAGLQVGQEQTQNVFPSNYFALHQFTRSYLHYR